MSPAPDPLLRTVLDQVRDGVLLLDADRRVVAANVAATHCFRTDPLGRSLADLGTPDGTEITVHDLDGSAGAGVVAVALVAAVPPERVALRSILEQMPASVIRLDADLRIVNVSDLWLLATGLRRERVEGMHLHDIGMPPRVRTELEPLVDDVVRTGRRARLETLVPTTVGLRWVEFVFVAERDGDGAITHVIGISSDVTHRKNKELSLTREATTDPLTGLLNRSGLNDELRRRSQVPAWVDTTLLLIDLDEFKQVNDRHGHLAGDAVLVQVADRIRTAAGDGVPVARLGGDEFVVLGDPAGSAAIAARILDAFTAPVVSDALTLRVRLSIGVAQVTATDEDLADLFNRADEAMYRAKRTGAGVIVDGAG